MFDSFALTQANRLLTLAFAPGSGIEENALLSYELSGREGISSGFTYTLSCLSADAFLELKDLIGLPAQIAILTDDGAQRALCGIVTAARSAGSNGGFSRYVLTLQDPFAALTRRINSRVFQDLSVREFTAILLQEHQQKNAVLAQCFDLQDQCRGEHPQQSWVTQFNESDTVFLQRWFAQEGIARYFAHGDAGARSEHARLTLVVIGPPGEEIHVNALGCVKIRMDFTRPQDHENAEGAGGTIHVGHWSERHAPGTLAPAEA